MNNLNLNKYLDIVNEEKIKKGLNNYVPLYPMLRVENDNMYIGVMLVKESDKVWNISGNVKAEYWALIDINSEMIVSFNKTSEKDFVLGNVIPKNTENKQKEFSKYTVEKTMQYRNYLMNDIKKEQLPLQKKLSSILGTKIEIDGEKVNINEYLLSNFEEEIKSKIDELVNVLIWSKYDSITFYYDKLFNQVLNSYKKDKTIDRDKIQLCTYIMNNYYDGVTAIDNFFNI